MILGSFGSVLADLTRLDSFGLGRPRAAAGRGHDRDSACRAGTWEFWVAACRLPLPGLLTNLTWGLAGWLLWPQPAPPGSRLCGLRATGTLDAGCKESCMLCGVSRSILPTYFLNDRGSGDINAFEVVSLPHALHAGTKHVGLYCSREATPVIHAVVA